MKFRMKLDVTFTVYLCAILIGACIQGIIMVKDAFIGSDIINGAVGFAFILIGVMGIIVHFTSYVEMTDEHVIIHTKLHKTQIPLADITAVTYKETFSTRTSIGTNIPGVILRDHLTTSVGETKIAVVEEEKFIKYLLGRAPHIRNELNDER